MTVSREIRIRAIALVEQLPDESLTKALEFLEALSDEASKVSETALVEPEEKALVQIIQHQLSRDDQTRLAYLRQQNEIGEITQTEHQELLAYVDRVESQDVERAEALIQLARIRKVELKTLLKEFSTVNRIPHAI